MRLTKCFPVQTGKATLLVLHTQLPPGNQTKGTTEYAMISISQDAVDRSANFHTNAADVLDLGTIKGSATSNSLLNHPHQLQL